jgi:hypothetical protein
MKDLASRRSGRTIQPRLGLVLVTLIRVTGDVTRCVALLPGTSWSESCSRASTASRSLTSSRTESYVVVSVLGALEALEGGHAQPVCSTPTPATTLTITDVVATVGPSAATPSSSRSTRSALREHSAAPAQRPTQCHQPHHGSAPSRLARVRAALPRLREDDIDCALRGVPWSRGVPRCRRAYGTRDKQAGRSDLELALHEEAGGTRPDTRSAWRAQDKLKEEEIGIQLMLLLADERQLDTVPGYHDHDSSGRARSGACLDPEARRTNRGPCVARVDRRSPCMRVRPVRSYALPNSRSRPATRPEDAPDTRTDVSSSPCSRISRPTLRADTFALLFELRMDARTTTTTAPVVRTSGIRRSALPEPTVLTRFFAPSRRNDARETGRAVLVQRAVCDPVHTSCDSNQYRRTSHVPWFTFA